ncbi:hypothetical protein R1sor_021876 [Riccia sorocarpa]|uniref:Uncharacterized protein n=1 Tax=Riccia sorocarpa TaxID=122646 RepID=A0ABD3GLE8_9MARC
MQPQAATSAVQHQQQGGQGGSPPPLVKLFDLRPSANSNVNTEFIILEKGQPARVSEGGPMVCVALVADSTAAAHLQLWGNECEAFQPSDIIRLTSGLFSYHKSNMVLRAGKKGTMEKIGGFSMVFVESPNMSRLQWVQDPNSKMLMPVGLGQQSSGALLRNPGGMYHESSSVQLVTLSWLS